MKSLKLWFLFVVILTVFGGLLLRYMNVSKRESCYGQCQENITAHLGVAVCGDRLKQSLVMLKSALTFGKSPIHAHIFADDAIRPLLGNMLMNWSKLVWWRSFNFTLYRSAFPKGEEHIWKNLFALCSSQRLFLPDLLPMVDSLIYVDTDAIFLTNPEHFWSQFTNFSYKHIVGLTSESEVEHTSVYSLAAQHPFYKPNGLNAGIMLMNLSRMRQFNWTKLHLPIYQKYKGKIPYGDNDIINIIFHHHPVNLYLLGCQWNYRDMSCMLKNVCAQHIGAHIVHGNAKNFEIHGKQPVFEALYETFKSYKLGDDVKEKLLEPLTYKLKLLSNGSKCGKVYEVFLRQIRNYVRLH